MHPASLRTWTKDKAEIDFGASKVVRATIFIDCGRQSGLGRMRRTLTLLDAFRASGVGVRVCLSHSDGAAFARQQGYDHEVGVPADLADDILIIDACSLSADEINDLCTQARISCVIDDLGDRPVVCDYIINPNLYAAQVDYSDYIARRIFNGPDHSLLAAEFFNHAVDDDDRRGIVVSFGGTDDGALAAAVAGFLSSKTTEPIYVPVPTYLEPSQALLDLAERRPSVRPLRNAEMPSLLGGARMYVGAAGATVMEAMASGCTVCVAATQKDQKQNASYLPTIGVPTLGFYHADAMAAMAEKAMFAKKPKMPFNAHAPMDIASTAIEAYNHPG